MQPLDADVPNKEALDLLQTLFLEVWNKPQSLTKIETVEYLNSVGKTTHKACTVFDLGNHALGLSSLGFYVERQLIIPLEYTAAFQYIENRFSAEKKFRKGSVITGQPGIGKTLFLLYVLLRCMQKSLPVALHVSSDGYYLIDGTGASFYRSPNSNPLRAHKRIWCLSNSGVEETAQTPALDFIRCSSAQIIQAASPDRQRWKSWAKECGARLYIMDCWDEDELIVLGHLAGQGQGDVPKILSEWGPCPRFLVSALTDPEWEKEAKQTIEIAANQLAENPEAVLASITTVAYESTASSVLWMRPRDKVANRSNFDAYVPDASIIAEAVRSAFNARRAVELATYFNKISRNSHAHGLAGYVFESLTHTTITSGAPEGITWYNLDDSPANISVVTSHQVISTRGELMGAKAPFYFQPGLANYPGIDSALCTGDSLYAIQATLSSKHSSVLGGLRKLYDELPHAYRPPKEKWHILFACTKLEEGRRLAETQRKEISESKNSEWKNLTIGYFIPLHMQEFTVLTDFNEKGKGRAVEGSAVEIRDSEQEPDLPSIPPSASPGLITQSMFPSTSSVPKNKRNRSKLSKNDNAVPTKKPKTE